MTKIERVSKFMHENAVNNDGWGDTVGSTSDMFGIKDEATIVEISIGVDFFDNGYQVSCMFSGSDKTFVYYIQESSFDKWVNRIKLIREELLEDTLDF